MPEHLVPLGMLVVVTSLLCFAARRAPGPWLDSVAVIIALAIVLAELSWQPYVLANHSWSAAFSLPVQVCDVGGFVAAAALIWRQALLVEIAYFWGWVARFRLCSRLISGTTSRPSHICSSMPRTISWCSRRYSWSLVCGYSPGGTPSAASSC